jgi:hypothetical protein
MSDFLTTREAGTLSGTNRDYISRARTVIRHAPDLAASVLAGSLSLDKAYEEARIRKGQADTYDSTFAVNLNIDWATRTIIGIRT